MSQARFSLFQTLFLRKAATPFVFPFNSDLTFSAALE